MVFQWQSNCRAITNEYTPTQQAITKCKEVSLAAQIQYLFFRQNPVSSCPEDTDSDGTNNNIDIDLDNDGILNTQKQLKYYLINPILL
jgi:hypothetical protein